MTVTKARQVLASGRSMLQARADELEAVLRLSLGDLPSVTELAEGCPSSAVA